MARLRMVGNRLRPPPVGGRLPAAAFVIPGELVGRPYAMSGRVAHGAKLGRSLGFPTANIRLKRKPPLAGIFAVRVHGLGDAPRPAVASVGVRPTVSVSGVPLLEVFVFDFDENI